MNKIEINFSARVPYNSDEDHLNRSTSMGFDVELDNNPEEIVRQFNKFLVLNDFEFVVGVK
jgi:hypothetical protein